MSSETETDLMSRVLAEMSRKKDGGLRHVTITDTGTITTTVYDSDAYMKLVSPMRDAEKLFETSKPGVYASATTGLSECNPDLDGLSKDVVHPGNQFGRSMTQLIEYDTGLFNDAPHNEVNVVIMHTVDSQSSKSSGELNASQFEEIKTNEIEYTNMPENDQDLNSNSAPSVLKISENSRQPPTEKGKTGSAITGDEKLPALYQHNVDSNHSMKDYDCSLSNFSDTSYTTVSDSTKENVAISRSNVGAIHNDNVNSGVNHRVDVDNVGKSELETWLPNASDSGDGKEALIWIPGMPIPYFESVRSSRLHSLSSESENSLTSDLDFDQFAQDFSSNHVDNANSQCLYNLNGNGDLDSLYNKNIDYNIETSKERQVSGHIIHDNNIKHSFNNVSELSDIADTTQRSQRKNKSFEKNEVEILRIVDLNNGKATTAITDATKYSTENVDLNKYDSLPIHQNYPKVFNTNEDVFTKINTLELDNEQNTVNASEWNDVVSIIHNIVVNKRKAYDDVNRSPSTVSSDSETIIERETQESYNTNDDLSDAETVVETLTTVDDVDLYLSDNRPANYDTREFVFPNQNAKSSFDTSDDETIVEIETIDPSQIETLSVTTPSNEIAFRNEIEQRNNDFKSRLYQIGPLSDCSDNDTITEAEAKCNGQEKVSIASSNCDNNYIYYSSDGETVRASEADDDQSTIYEEETVSIHETYETNLYSPVDVIKGYTQSELESHTTSSVYLDNFWDDAINSTDYKIGVKVNDLEIDMPMIDSLKPIDEADEIEYLRRRGLNSAELSRRESILSNASSITEVSELSSKYESIDDIEELSIKETKTKDGYKRRPLYQGTNTTGKYTVNELTDDMSSSSEDSDDAGVLGHREKRLLSHFPLTTSSITDRYKHTENCNVDVKGVARSLENKISLGGFFTPYPDTALGMRGDENDLYVINERSIYSNENTDTAFDTQTNYDIHDRNFSANLNYALEELNNTELNNLPIEIDDVTYESKEKHDSTTTLQYLFDAKQPDDTNKTSLPFKHGIYQSDTEQLIREKKKNQYNDSDEETIHDEIEIVYHDASNNVYSRDTISPASGSALSESSGVNGNESGWKPIDSYTSVAQRDTVAVGGKVYTPTLHKPEVISDTYADVVLCQTDEIVNRAVTGEAKSAKYYRPKLISEDRDKHYIEEDRLLPSINKVDVTTRSYHGGLSTLRESLQKDEYTKTNQYLNASDRSNIHNRRMIPRSDLTHDDVDAELNSNDEHSIKSSFIKKRRDSDKQEWDKEQKHVSIMQGVIMNTNTETYNHSVDNNYRNTNTNTTDTEITHEAFPRSLRERIEDLKQTGNENEADTDMISNDIDGNKLPMTTPSYVAERSEKPVLERRKSVQEHVLDIESIESPNTGYDFETEIRYLGDANSSQCKVSVDHDYLKPTSPNVSTAINRGGGFEKGVVIERDCRVNDESPLQTKPVRVVDKPDVSEFSMNGSTKAEPCAYIAYNNRSDVKFTPNEAQLTQDLGPSNVISRNLKKKPKAIAEPARQLNGALKHVSDVSHVTVKSRSDDLNHKNSFTTLRCNDTVIDDVLNCESSIFDSSFGSDVSSVDSKSFRNVLRALPEIESNQVTAELTPKAYETCRENRYLSQYPSEAEHTRTATLNRSIDSAPYESRILEPVLYKSDIVVSTGRQNHQPPATRAGPYHLRIKTHSLGDLSDKDADSERVYIHSSNVRVPILSRSLRNVFIEQNPNKHVSTIFICGKPNTSLVQDTILDSKMTKGHLTDQNANVMKHDTKHGKYKTDMTHFNDAGVTTINVGNNAASPVLHRYNAIRYNNSVTQARELDRPWGYDISRASSASSLNAEDVFNTLDDTLSKQSSDIVYKASTQHIQIDKKVVKNGKIVQEESYSQDLATKTGDEKKIREPTSPGIKDMVKYLEFESTSPTTKNIPGIDSNAWSYHNVSQVRHPQANSDNIIKKQSEHTYENKPTLQHQQRHEVYQETLQNTADGSKLPNQYAQQIHVNKVKPTVQKSSTLPRATSDKNEPSNVPFIKEKSNNTILFSAPGKSQKTPVRKDDKIGIQKLGKGNTEFIVKKESIRVVNTVINNQDGFELRPRADSMTSVDSMSAVKWVDDDLHAASTLLADGASRNHGQVIASNDVMFKQAGKGFNSKTSKVSKSSKTSGEMHFVKTKTGKDSRNTNKPEHGVSRELSVSSSASNTSQETVKNIQIKHSQDNQFLKQNSITKRDSEQSVKTEHTPTKSKSGIIQEKTSGANVKVDTNIPISNVDIQGGNIRDNRQTGSRLVNTPSRSHNRPENNKGSTQGRYANRSSEIKLEHGGHVVSNNSRTDRTYINQSFENTKHSPVKTQETSVHNMPQDKKNVSRVPYDFSSSEHKPLANIVHLEGASNLKTHDQVLQRQELNFNRNNSNNTGLLEVNLPADQKSAVHINSSPSTASSSDTEKWKIPPLRTSTVDRRDGKPHQFREEKHNYVTSETNVYYDIKNRAHQKYDKDNKSQSKKENKSSKNYVIKIDSLESTPPLDSSTRSYHSSSDKHITTVSFDDSDSSLSSHSSQSTVGDNKKKRKSKHGSPINRHNYQANEKPAKHDKKLPKRASPSTKLISQRDMVVKESLSNSYSDPANRNRHGRPGSNPRSPLDISRSSLFSDEELYLRKVPSIPLTKEPVAMTIPGLQDPNISTSSFSIPLGQDFRRSMSLESLREPTSFELRPTRSSELKPDDVLYVSRSPIPRESESPRKSGSPFVSTITIMNRRLNVKDPSGDSGTGTEVCSSDDDRKKSEYGSLLRPVSEEMKPSGSQRKHRKSDRHDRPRSKSRHRDRESHTAINRHFVDETDYYIRRRKIYDSGDSPDGSDTKSKQRESTQQKEPSSGESPKRSHKSEKHKHSSRKLDSDNVNQERRPKSEKLVTHQASRRRESPHYSSEPYDSDNKSQKNSSFDHKNKTSVRENNSKQKVYSVDITQTKQSKRRSISDDVGQPDDQPHPKNISQRKPDYSKQNKSPSTDSASSDSDRPRHVNDENRASTHKVYTSREIVKNIIEKPPQQGIAKQSTRRHSRESSRDSSTTRDSSGSPRRRETPKQTKSKVHPGRRSPEWVSSRKRGSPRNSPEISNRRRESPERKSVSPIPLKSHSLRRDTQETQRFQKESIAHTERDRHRGQGHSSEDSSGRKSRRRKEPETYSRKSNMYPGHEELSFGNETFNTSSKSRERVVHMEYEPRLNASREMNYVQKTVDDSSVNSNDINSNHIHGESFEYKPMKQYVPSSSEHENDDALKVVTGKILIKNSMDISLDDEEDLDNVNIFDDSFSLNKDNPLYHSDPDVSKTYDDKVRKDSRSTGHRKHVAEVWCNDEEERERDNIPDCLHLTFQSNNLDVPQAGALDTADGIGQIIDETKRTAVGSAPNRRKQNLSSLLLSKLSQIDAKDVTQHIDVEHKHEEIYGDINFIHADGSKSSARNTTNFDTVSEHIDLILREGKAVIIIKVIAERIIPIDTEFNVWRKSQAIVTRNIEINLKASDQRRRLYDHVMRNTSQKIEATKGNWDEEGTLNSRDTLKLFSRLLTVADKEEGGVQKDALKYRSQQGDISNDSFLY